VNVVLWIVAGLLALVFVASGVRKLTTPKDKLYESGMTYVEDFSDNQVRAIGAVEVLGGLGLIVPAFIGQADWLVPTAAAGLVLVMIGAILTHVRRKEQFIPPLVLGLLAAFAAVGRFWIASF
jgi:uncharacterized membrane protein YphA (DoxX/SURF4 family)